MKGQYDCFLVAVSFAIATLGAWAGLDFSSRIYLQKSRQKKNLWLSLGAFAMGTGIWSMHYTGMVAYRMPMPVLYDWPTVVLSMLAAFLASGVVLELAARQSLSMTNTVLGGMAMGGAVASMHYIGMAAMRMPMTLTYSFPKVILSIVAAVLISIIGVRLTFESRLIERGWSGKKAASALVMGLAIPTMHYLGMAAATMRPQETSLRPADLQHAISISGLSTAGIVLGSLLVIIVAVVSSRLDHHVSKFESALGGTARSFAQLQAHHERLQGAFRAGGFGIWECDPATGLFYVDAKLRDLFGTPQDGKPVPRAVWRASVHPEDLQMLDRVWSDALLSEDKYENEYRVIRPEGEIRTVHSVATLVRHPDGSLKRVLGMTWDVTAERRREQEIQEQATRFRLTLDAIGDAVIATDEQLQVSFMNPVACRLTGWDTNAGIGQNLREVFITRDEHTDALRKDPVQRCIEQGGVLLAEDGVLISRTGERFNIRKHVALMEKGQAAVITFQDITEARRMEKQLLHDSSHDSLTDLANRAAFERTLHRFWEDNRFGGRVHCVCMLDLDRFKIINDASGHPAGDQLLKEIANILRQELRGTDIAARMGGDEFMLLLTDMSAEEALVTAERLIYRIASHRFLWQDRTYTVTASLGIVSFDCFSPEPEVLISQADAASFTAKRDGRNRISVYMDQGSAAEHYLEMQMAADLRRCIDEDCFELYAQPIVPSQALQDHGYFEILLRMKGSDGTLVSPALFIPAAERNGLMGLVDRWVIRKTFAMLGSLEGSGPQVRFAINLSAESLSDSTLWSFVSAQLRLTGISPSAITFEITETAIIRDLHIAKDFIASCRRAGCRVALDDFGTGLSSLSYLKHFSLDTIKIDGGFIRSIVQNPMDQAIVRAIGEVARSIGATTVAECVEDVAAIAMVKDLGITYVQGWATGRPIPLETALRKQQIALSFEGSYERLSAGPILIQ